MFDLEKSIVAWRKQMLAAGISSPTLDELENHLREEFERQVKMQIDQRLAFETAAGQIGQPYTLKSEFRKTQLVIKSGHLSRRFASGMFLVSGLTSLVLLLFVKQPVHAIMTVNFSNTTPLLDLYTKFGNGAFQDSNFAQRYLVLSLILTTLFAFVRFRLTKQPFITHNN